MKQRYERHYAESLSTSETLSFEKAFVLWWKGITGSISSSCVEWFCPSVQESAALWCQVHSQTRQTHYATFSSPLKRQSAELIFCCRQGSPAGTWRLLACGFIIVGARRARPSKMVAAACLRALTWASWALPARKVRLSLIHREISFPLETHIWLWSEQVAWDRWGKGVAGE